MSLQNCARCTAEFKPNCWQQSQTAQTKWFLLASYTLGRFPDWVGRELENCQASTKCRIADKNLRALLCKELVRVSNRHSGDAAFTSCCKNLPSVHKLRYWQQTMISFCCGWPKLKVFQSSLLCGRIQKWIPSSGPPSWGYLPRTGASSFWQRKSCFVGFFCSFKNWLKYLWRRVFSGGKGISPHQVVWLNWASLFGWVCLNAHLGM